jgi:hypothetical protein
VGLPKRQRAGLPETAQAKKTGQATTRRSRRRLKD